MHLAPNPALIQIMLAQALLATNNKAHAEEAVSLLRTALQASPNRRDAYAQLAMAYGRKGDLAQADLASAQAAFSRGEPRPRASSPRAPRRVFRSARRAG